MLNTPIESWSETFRCEFLRRLHRTVLVIAEQDPINPEPAVVAALVGNLENERAGQVPQPDNPVEAPQNPEVNLICFFWVRPDHVARLHSFFFLLVALKL